MALELSQIVPNYGFRSLSQKVFIRPLSNLVNMLVGIISRSSSINCQIPRDSWILPLELSKNWISGICFPKSNILLPKLLSLPLNLPQIWRAYFVSVWHSCCIFWSYSVNSCFDCCFMLNKVYSYIDFFISGTQIIKIYILESTCWFVI